MQALLIITTGSWLIVSRILSLIDELIASDFGYITWTQRWKYWIPPILGLAAISGSKIWLSLLSFLCIAPFIHTWWQKRTRKSQIDRVIQEMIQNSHYCIATLHDNGEIDCFHLIHDRNIDQAIVTQMCDAYEAQGMAYRILKWPDDL